MFHDVILYSTDCPRCKILERKLDSNNIDYSVCKDIDVMEQLGIMSVPMLSVDDKLLDFGKAIKWANNPRWN